MTDHTAALAQVRTALVQIVEMLNNLDEPATPQIINPSRYGEAPVQIAGCNLAGAWDEFMHYLYLPVRIPAEGLCQPVPDGLRASSHIPERLRFMEQIVLHVVDDARQVDPERFADPYVYLTMRRGFATPGNPLNRPGWHCDDFGGNDLNYIWTDRFGTRFLHSPSGLDIPEDDAESMVVMEKYAAWASDVEGGTAAHHDVHIEEMQPGNIFRLSPYVIHETPVIPHSGGMRSFFKISVSDHRYNLLGNSHNHGIDYEWEMHDRAVIRNQPGGNRDYWETGPGSDREAFRAAFDFSTMDRVRMQHGISSDMCGSLLWSLHPNSEHEQALHVQAICDQEPHDSLTLHSDGTESWGNVEPPPDDMPLCNHPERP